jgi:hypothetical protein
MTNSNINAHIQSPHIPEAQVTMPLMALPSTSNSVH